MSVSDKTGSFALAKPVRAKDPSTQLPWPLKAGVSSNVTLTAVSQRALRPPARPLSGAAINNPRQEHGQVSIILKAQAKAVGTKTHPSVFHPALCQTLQSCSPQRPPAVLGFKPTMLVEFLMLFC